MPTNTTGCATSSRRPCPPKPCRTPLPDVLHLAPRGDGALRRRKRLRRLHLDALLQHLPAARAHAPHGRAFCGKYSVAFHYEDFRPGWQEGIDISHELDLYRQPYCGCIFSEEERYSREIRKQRKKENKAKKRARLEREAREAREAAAAINS